MEHLVIPDSFEEAFPFCSSPEGAILIFIGKSEPTAEMLADTPGIDEAYVWRILPADDSTAYEIHTDRTLGCEILRRGITIYGLLWTDKEHLVELAELINHILADQELVPKIQESLTSALQNLELTFNDEPPVHWPFVGTSLAKEATVTYLGRAKEVADVHVFRITHPAEATEARHFYIPRTAFPAFHVRAAQTYGHFTFPAKHIDSFHELINECTSDVKLRPYHAYLTDGWQKVEQEFEARSFTMVGSALRKVTVKKARQVTENPPALDTSFTNFFAEPSIDLPYTGKTSRLLYQGRLKAKVSGSELVDLPKSSSPLWIDFHKWQVLHPQKGSSGNFMTFDGGLTFAGFSSALWTCDTLEFGNEDRQDLIQLLRVMARSETWPVLFPDGTEFTPTPDVRGVFARIADDVERRKSTTLDLTKFRTPELQEQYLSTCNTASFQAFREAIAKNAFTQVPDSPYPTARLQKGGAAGFAQMRPPVEDPTNLTPQETDLWTATIWRFHKDLSDLDADVMDALLANWLQSAHTPNDSATMGVEDLLQLRGIQQKKSGTGRRGGFAANVRDEHLKALARAQTFWLRIEVPGYGKGKKRYAVESQAVAITDRMGQLRIDGTVDMERFIYRPGEVFSRFLFGEGRQAALLSANALRYDYYRQKEEKRLTRYLSWQWRNEARRAQYVKSYRVETLLTETGQTPTPRYGDRVRERLEKALDTLQRDGIIAAWHYDPATWQESRATQRNWFPTWLMAKVVIEAPAKVKEHYRKIEARPVKEPRALPTSDLAERLRQAMTDRKITAELRAAEAIGIPQQTLNRILKGSNPSKKNREKIETWLSAGK